VRISLVPENKKFYDLIEMAGDNMVEATRMLCSVLNEYHELDPKLERLHELEHKGDEITHEAITSLNQTFVTPFDREDIAFLMRRLDDVVDFSWAASVRLQAFSIETITETAISFGRIICRQAEILSESLVLLRKRHQMKEILGLCREVHALENEADVVLRGALAKRYNATPHTIEGLILAMKWSEIYGILEKASDRAEDIADTLQSIVLKYA